MFKPTTKQTLLLTPLIMILLANSATASTRSNNKKTTAFIVDNIHNHQTTFFRDLSPPKKSHSQLNSVYDDFMASIVSDKNGRIRHQQQQQQPETSTILNTEASTNTESDDTTTITKNNSGVSSFDNAKKNGAVVCTSELEVPFSADVAFDAFSDLTRQPSWSPWLKSVKYTNEEKTRTQWKMRYMGVSQSWETECDRKERPNVIEWSSISGMKNYGKMEFISLGPNKTLVRMSIGFVFPKLLTQLMKRGGTQVPDMIEKKMLEPTLENFKNVVLVEDLGQSPESVGSKEQLTPAMA